MSLWKSHLFARVFGLNLHLFARVFDVNLHLFARVSVIKILKDVVVPQKTVYLYFVTNVEQIIDTTLQQ